MLKVSEAQLFALHANEFSNYLTPVMSLRGSLLPFHFLRNPLPAIDDHGASTGQPWSHHRLLSGQPANCLTIEVQPGKGPMTGLDYLRRFYLGCCPLNGSVFLADPSITCFRRASGWVSYLNLSLV
jgi:hypothetical protein